MKKITVFSTLLLAIFAIIPVHAANFYWKASTTDLNAIAAPSAGDRGIVITDAGAVSYWTYSGSAWVQANSTFTDQTANTVFAGPSTGSAAAPSFRSLVAADIPSLTATYAAVAGTPSSTFQLDNDASGPKLKNNSGTFEARNAADDAYADFKGKDAYFAHIYSTAANGAYYGNWDNTVSITFTPAQGDFWSESGVPYFRDATTNRKVLHAGSSAADFPKLDQDTTGTAAGLTAQYIDWSASSGGASIANKPIIVDWTADQGATNIHSGNIPDLSGTYAVTSHTHTYTESFVVKSPVDADDFLLMKASAALTITALNCVSQVTTSGSITAAVQECDGDGANCADGGISLTADGSNDADTSFTDASIDSGDWLKVVLGAPSGTVNFLSCTMSYTR